MSGWLPSRSRSSFSRRSLRSGVRGWSGKGSGSTAVGSGSVLVLSRSGSTGSSRRCSPTPSSVGSSPYGGVFVAGSLAWGMVADGYRPDRWDLAGAAVCLAGVGLIMYAPRS